MRRLQRGPRSVTSRPTMMAPNAAYLTTVMVIGADQPGVPSAA